jgi:hypothetical protein
VSAEPPTPRGYFIFAALFAAYVVVSVLWTLGVIDP